MPLTWKNPRALLLCALLPALAVGACTPGARVQTATEEIKLLNVSYDPTREFYADFNAAFAKRWAADHGGQKVTVEQSHGGSGKQARAVIDGLQADVVTLGLPYDIDALVQNGGLVNKDWRAKFPNDATPYTSTVVFLVRKGNPKGIRDWADLVKSGVGVITPNPKTSAGGRWSYVAAWGYALRANGGDEKQARDYLARLYKNVPVLDTGARGSTTTFAQRNQGDVLLAWENEAYLSLDEFGRDKFEVVYPSLSCLAEPPVAVVDKNVDAHKTRAAAEAYLNYLYTEEAQDIAGRRYYRPRSATAAAKYAAQFPKVDLFTVDEVLGGWEKANKTHFAEGGVFDQIYRPQ